MTFYFMPYKFSSGSPVVNPGDMYGRWEVIKVGYRTAGQNTVYVDVECECGERKYVDLGTLKAGKSRGCGSCAQQNRRKKKDN